MFIDLYAKEDNWHNIDKATGNLGYGWVHYGFIRNFLPERVLVIGSRYGFIPAICAMACRDNCKGKVDFVDAGYDQNELGYQNHWGGVGFWEKTNINRHFGKYDLNEYIKVHAMTSKQFFRRYNNRKWSYIYIDGDHSYKGVKYDFKHSWPLLKNGGIIALHDIHVKKTGSLTLGVHKLWKKLKASQKYNTIEIPGEFGLGLIQK